ncbi:MAG: DUF4956 domain-containing protein [Lachnospiraceae bacterium]
MLLSEMITGTTVFTMQSFLLCLIVSLVIGIWIAWLYMFKTKYTKSFVVTLAVMPTIVCMIIMMVNGNIGAGVAVAGTFSLVRFRSVPGTAKEIGAIFLAMGAGLVMGMGYISLAVIFVVIVGIANLLLTISPFGDNKDFTKSLTITIPEDLDYTDVFEDLFEAYTTTSEIERVKTTNMGSLFKLTYIIEMKPDKMEKNFIDEIRCRNGNLEVMISKRTTVGVEL